MSGLLDLKLGTEWQITLKAAHSKLRKLQGQLGPALSQTLRAEAEFIAGAMREKFDRVRPANARVTKFLKGSSKPLVNTGDLRNSIGVVEVSPTTFYVGIPEDVGSAKLALIHEKGVTIVQQMTDKQRRFLHAALPPETRRARLARGKKVSTGIIVIHIPARPFIEPTFRAQSRLSTRRFTQALIASLGL